VDCHYTGTTAQGGPISFDLVAGRTVTNVMFTVDALSRKPGGPGFADAPIAITGRFKVSDEGSFGGTVKTQQTTVKIEGSIDGDSGEVSGVLRVDAVVVYRGTARHCSSGVLEWSARGCLR
jgi:hypothetical protein